MRKEQEDQRPVAFKTLLVKSSIWKKIHQCWQFSESGDFYRAVPSLLPWELLGSRGGLLRTEGGGCVGTDHECSWQHFGPICDIEVVLTDGETRKMAKMKTENGKVENNVFSMMENLFKER